MLTNEAIKAAITYNENDILDAEMVARSAYTVEDRNRAKASLVILTTIREALQAPQTSRPDAGDELDAVEWVDIQIEHHENQISELKPMDIYRHSHEYERLKTIRAALKSGDKGREADDAEKIISSALGRAQLARKIAKSLCMFPLIPRREDEPNEYRIALETTFTHEITKILNEHALPAPPTSEGV